MYKCDWFFFLHFCLLCATLFTRQLKWPLWAILCWCEADFSCVVTLRQEVRARLCSHPSSADHLHQLSKAKRDRLNGFCVIYAEEPALCHPLWRTWRSQGRCSLPGWSNVPPAHALQSCSVASAMSTCIYMQAPVGLNLCQSCYRGLAHPPSPVSHSQHKCFSQQILTIQRTPAGPSCVWVGAEWCKSLTGAGWSW